MFTLFGEPDIEIVDVGDVGDDVTVELRGVDVDDPTTGEVRSDENPHPPDSAGPHQQNQPTTRAPARAQARACRAMRGELRYAPRATRSIRW